jgi:hypothetical protein
LFGPRLLGRFSWEDFDELWIMQIGMRITRKVIVVYWCNMCNRSRKSIDIFFLHCDMARELWMLLISLFDVEWVMLGKLTELLQCWRGQVGSCSVLDICRISHLGLM